MSSLRRSQFLLALNFLIVGLWLVPAWADQCDGSTIQNGTKYGCQGQLDTKVLTAARTPIMPKTSDIGQPDKSKEPLQANASATDTLQKYAPQGVSFLTNLLKLSGSKGPNVGSPQASGNSGQAACKPSGPTSGCAEKPPQRLEVDD